MEQHYELMRDWCLMVSMSVFQTEGPSSNLGVRSMLWDVSSVGRAEDS